MKKLIVILALRIACIEGWAQINDTVITNIQDTNTGNLLLDEQPIFKKNQLKFLSKNIKYPSSAYLNRIEGRVIVEFIIEKDGSVSNIKTLKGIGSGCDEEAERVIELTSGMWIPGKNNGQPVRTRMMQPIYYKLPTKKSK